jgi:hypothetical protein
VDDDAVERDRAQRLAAEAAAGGGALRGLEGRLGQRARRSVPPAVEAGVRLSLLDEVLERRGAGVREPANAGPGQTSLLAREQRREAVRRIQGRRHQAAAFSASIQP